MNPAIDLRQILRAAENKLRKAGVASPKRDAELLLAHRLGLERHELYLNDFADFRMMITPIIIKVLFWIGAVGAFAYGAYRFFSLIGWGFFDWFSLLIMLVGPFVWRIFCESFLLLFQIHGELKKLNEK